MTNTKTVLLSFSGNMQALNPLDAEKRAMLYLYSQFVIRGYKGCSLQIFTDSMVLVDISSKNKTGIYQVNILVEDEEWYEFIRDPFVKISYVKRKFLKGVDALAKEGKHRAGVCSVWC